MIKPRLSPKVIPSTMLLACLLPVEETTPVVQALVIKHPEEVTSPPIVRMKNSMMQDPPAPLVDHQGITLEPLSIILAYPLSVRNVVPTLTSNKRRGLSLNGQC
jgi:hypothetical protein